MTFLRDFFSSIYYFAQNGVLYILHLSFHIVTKILNLLGNVIFPALVDLFYETLFVLMIIYQGFCEVMTTLCISMSGGFIKMGKFFNNQSEKLITKNWM